VGGLAEAEIFVTDEAHGRRSRGEGGAFKRPKAGRVEERLSSWEVLKRCGLLAVNVYVAVAG
jgi:hypothetical protein